jgi:hypothetical protein
MRTRITTFTILALAALLPPAGAAMAAAPAKRFKVTSTLDGKSVLPHHLRWQAYVTLPPAQVKKVEFLIDGKVRWVETIPAYIYSSDQEGNYPGYLVTSWLTPGLHRFAVRVHASGQRTATDTVKARVLPAAEVPVALAGTWQRTLADPVPPTAGATGDETNPAGTYTITFDKRWIQDHYPGTYDASKNSCDGCITDDDYVPSASTFQVWGSVTIAPESTWEAEGGWWCNAGGPGATYTWTVSGSTLTLTPVGGTDRCSQRGTTWTGQWTRAE